jgi:transcriptional regulator
MYLPAHFRVDDPEKLTAVIQAAPLAMLITLVDGVPTADHIPLTLAKTPTGLQLHGHIAKANPMHRHVGSGTEVLAVFRSADSYVSPNHYPSKKEHGKAVPTWNYQVVHVRGPLTWHADIEAGRAIVTALTEEHEAGRPHPWAVSDAPHDYIDTMLNAIVAFSIDITSMVGKFKASQNRVASDRAGLRDGLAGEGLTSAQVAALAREPET